MRSSQRRRMFSFVALIVVVVAVAAAVGVCAVTANAAVGVSVASGRVRNRPKIKLSCGTTFKGAVLGLAHSCRFRCNCRRHKRRRGRIKFIDGRAALLDTASSFTSEYQSTNFCTSSTVNASSLSLGSTFVCNTSLLRATAPVFNANAAMTIVPRLCSHH